MRESECNSGKDLTTLGMISHACVHIHTCTHEKVKLLDLKKKRKDTGDGGGQPAINNSTGFSAVNRCSFYK